MPLFPASAELGRASGLSKRFVCVRSLVSRLSAVRNPGSPWVSCVGIDRAAIGRPPCRPGPSGPSGPQPPAGKVFLSAIDPAESAGRSLRRRRRASRRSALAAPSQAPARVLHGRREVTAGRICCVSRFVKPVRQDRAGRSFAPRRPAARVRKAARMRPSQAAARIGCNIFSYGPEWNRRSCTHRRRRPAVRVRKAARMRPSQAAARIGCNNFTYGPEWNRGRLQPPETNTATPPAGALARLLRRLQARFDLLFAFAPGIGTR